MAGAVGKLWSKTLYTVCKVFALAKGGRDMTQSERIKRDCTPFVFLIGLSLTGCCAGYNDGVN